MIRSQLPAPDHHRVKAGPEARTALRRALAGGIDTLISGADDAQIARAAQVMADPDHKSWARLRADRGAVPSAGRAKPNGIPVGAEFCPIDGLWRSVATLYVALGAEETCSGRRC